MKRKTIYFLLSLACAATTLAAEARIEPGHNDSGVLSRTNDAFPAPIVTEKYEYYEVCGICEEELQCDLRKKCIKWNDGRKYDSVTQWHVKWDYDREQAPQACSAKAFRVTVDIVFRYPKWTPPDDVSRSLVRKWDVYIKNLVAHETGHRDIAVEKAAELSRAVTEMPSFSDCDKLDSNLQALSRDRMEKLNKAQKKYDEVTRHGAAQGAVFQ